VDGLGLHQRHVTTTGEKGKQIHKKVTFLLRFVFWRCGSEKISKSNLQRQSDMKTCQKTFYAMQYIKGKDVVKFFITNTQVF
jgi:hypothetical protein